MSQIDSDSEPVEYWSSSDESNSSVEIILDAPSNHASAQADPSNAQAGPSSRGITLATRQPARVPGSTAYPLGGWMNAPPVRMPRHNGTPPPPPPYLHPPTYSDPSAPPPVAGPPSGSPPPNYPSANAPPPAFLPAGGAGHAIPRRRPEGNILEAANREAERIKQYFDQNPRQFTFEGKIGNGMTGVSCQIKQRRRWYSTSSSTRFIVKRAIYPYQEPFLQNEIRTLR
ncbi:hypothetical protein F5X99DRAFT_334013 [Biscogniauxia marginata]|nr:hypothetical protein F5X99DRAFT_334013 [Biscogniauxia marginata]